VDWPRFFLRCVVRVNSDVAFRQIAGPDRRASRPRVQRNTDSNFLRIQLLRRELQISIHQRHIVDKQFDLLTSERDS